MTELKRVELNEMDLEAVVGGKRYRVAGTKNYLALRNDTCYDDDNIIGKLHNGDYVNVYEKHGRYWLCETRKGRMGYVDHRYLRAA